MSKHTEGPWSVGEVRERKYPRMGTRYEALVQVGEAERAGNAIAIVHMGGPGAIYAELEGVMANAHLIAAAPDLLRAVRGLLAVFAQNFEPGVSPGVDFARAAAAKATRL